MQSFVLIHTSEYGTSTYRFKTEKEVNIGYWFGEECEHLEIQWILDALSIDFEPDREETIYIDEDPESVTI